MRLHHYSYIVTTDQAYRVKYAIMFLKLIVVLLSSQVSSFINLSQSVVAHALPQDGSGDQYPTVTYYVDWYVLYVNFLEQANF